MKPIQRIALWTASVFGALVLVLAVLIGQTAWRVLHGVEVYETVPPTLPADHRWPGSIASAAGGPSIQSWGASPPPTPSPCTAGC